jgi:hypothetical protein
MSCPFIKHDFKIVISSFILCVFSAIGLCCKLASIAYFSVVLADLYVIYVVFYAARRSDKYKNDDWTWGLIIPNKFAGVIVFIFLYLSVVFGLAAVFLAHQAPDYMSRSSAWYKSWIAITSFSYEVDYSKYSGIPWRLQALQVWQAFNGILLWTATFGFLISRISNFKERKTLEDVYQLLEEIRQQKDRNGEVHGSLNQLNITKKTLAERMIELEKKISDLENRVG